MDEILVRMMEHVREQGMKKRGEVVFEDNFKKILLILEVFQNDYQTKRMDIRLVNEFWKEFEMVDGTVKFFCGGKILLNRIRGN